MRLATELANLADLFSQDIGGGLWQRTCGPDFEPFVALQLPGTNVTVIVSNYLQDDGSVGHALETIIPPLGEAEMTSTAR